MASQPYTDTDGYKPADGKATPVEPGVQYLPEAEKAKKSYVPEGYESVDDYLRDVRETYEIDRDADKDNREAAVDDSQFAQGKQWADEVLAYRRGLPCLTINTTGPLIAQVVGEFRLNPISIKVLPKEDGDVDVAAIRSDLIRNIEIQSRAKRIFTKCISEQATCGVSAFRICLRYANDHVFDQDIYIEEIKDPAVTVTWDHMSCDITGRDAAHCYIEDTIPRKVYEKRYPDQPISEFDATWGSSTYGINMQPGWLDKDTVRIVEHWRMITRKRTIAMFADGSIQDMTGEPVNVLNLWIDPCTGKPRIREVDKRYAQMHLITGMAILEGPYELPINRLPIIKVVGNEVTAAGVTVRSGLLRPAKDALRLRNFWRSKEAESLGYSTNAKWMAEARSVEGREEDFRNSHLNNDPLLVYNDGTTPPQRIDPPVMEAAFMNEAAVNAQDIKDVTGLHDASLGVRSNETSGKAIMARQREGDVATMVYRDNIAESIMEGGDVINQLIPVTHDAARTIRIVGEDEEPKLQRINDPMDPDAIDMSKGEYDVTITTGASFTTKRVEAFDAMMQMVQADPSLMQKAGDLIFKAMDAPMAEELAERLRKTMPPELTQEEGEGPVMPPAVEAQMQQMMQALQAMEAENQALKEDREAEMRKADADGYKAETDRLKALVDAMNNPMAAQVMWPVIRKGLIDIGASPDVLPVEPPMPMQPEPALEAEPTIGREFGPRPIESAPAF